MFYFFLSFIKTSTYSLCITQSPKKLLLFKMIFYYHFSLSQTNKVCNYFSVCFLCSLDLILCIFLLRYSFTESDKSTCLQLFTWYVYFAFLITVHMLIDEIYLLLEFSIWLNVNFVLLAGLVLELIVVVSHRQAMN